MYIYSLTLALHSLFRWLVLIGLVYTIFNSFRGWTTRRNYNDRIRTVTTIIVHTQLILGLCLCYLSPLVNYFIKNYHTAIHESEPRFFGMEHSSVMITGIIVITIGSVLAKRKTDDTKKFKTLAIWFLIGLLLILSSVPWPFSPFISRPYFRFF